MPPLTSAPWPEVWQTIWARQNRNLSVNQGHASRAVSLVRFGSQPVCTPAQASAGCWRPVALFWFAPGRVHALLAIDVAVPNSCRACSRGQGKMTSASRCVCTLGKRLGQVAPLHPSPAFKEQRLESLQIAQTCGSRAGPAGHSWSAQTLLR